MKYVHREKTDTYDVLHDNGFYFGYLYREIDGFYVWQPSAELFGCLPSYILLSIGNYLEHLNEDYQHKLESS